MFEQLAGSRSNEFDADVPGPQGQVRVVFAPTVGDVLDEAREWCARAAPSRRMVMDRIETVTGVDELINILVGNLADVASALWPAWYGSGVTLPDARLPPTEFTRCLGEALLAANLTRRAVIPAWTRRASTLCRRGKPPRPRGFTPAVEAAQLARVIEPDDLLMIIGIAVVKSEHLLGVARAVEWFAHATDARLLVVLPESAQTADALDGINYGTLHWNTAHRQAPVHRQEITEEHTERVWPTVGTPHPFSPGEQLLAMRLRDDAELAGLFGYNMAVRSRFGRLFFADLLWEAGQLIVEVDGYGHHSDRRAFAGDRQRDYELSATGFLTVRIPHDEVMSDSERAIEKIRTLVRLRQARATSGNAQRP